MLIKNVNSIYLKVGKISQILIFCELIFITSNHDHSGAYFKISCVAKISIAFIFHEKTIQYIISLTN